MQIRQATPEDADGMSRILREIIAVTGRERAFVQANYIANPSGVRCSVAVGDDGEALGFQSLIRARADNPYGLEEGCGVIGADNATAQTYYDSLGFKTYREPPGVVQKIYVV